MVLKTGLIPKSIQIGNIDIRWYAIIIVSAMILALLICKKYNGRYGIKFDTILDFSLFVIPISIICARIYFVLFSFDLYKDNLWEVFKINNGGLAIYGGIIGGLIVIAILCKIKKVKLLDLTDYIAPVIALAQSIGRWGNYINVEAYGYETDSFIKMEVVENGYVKHVHPTFLYESVCTFIIFCILSYFARKRKFSGQITYMYIILYSFIRFFIEGLRTDSLMLGNFRISQILSLILLVVFSIIMAYKIFNCFMSKSVDEKCEK